MGGEGGGEGGGGGDEGCGDGGGGLGDGGVGGGNKGIGGLGGAGGGEGASWIVSSKRLNKTVKLELWCSSRMRSTIGASWSFSYSFSMGVHVSFTHS